MQNDKPLVSVVIPTYNYGRFMPDAIDSILNQDFPQGEIEIIVVDDGSIDGTGEIIEEKYRDRVKYIYQENSGKAVAIRNGIEAAHGKYIFTLDADDIFLPGKIEKAVNIFENDNSIVYVSHPVIYWYADKNMKKQEKLPAKICGKKICGKDLVKFYYKRNKFFGLGSTISARAEAIKRIPINGKDIGYTIDEYLAMFLMEKGDAFFIEELLSLYRVHSKSYSIKKLKERARLDALARKFMLSLILASSFDEEIKALAILKAKIAELKLKEIKGIKSFFDIKDLWLHILSNRRLFGKDIFKIIKDYRILQRSMPVLAINLLRKSR
ncbi:MAG: glycosyltransferase family 2 protein [Candidatus Omnitrophota bacterium]|nr:MAG: glycosyltransferase family 2 protein [Candidatus Omnitrophota bacterium]